MRIAVGVMVVVFLFIAVYFFFLRNPEIVPKEAMCCASPVVSNTLSGKKIFSRNCASCHGINAGGTGIVKNVVSKGKGRMRALPYISGKKLEILSNFISSLK